MERHSLMLESILLGLFIAGCIIFTLNITSQTKKVRQTAIPSSIEVKTTDATSNSETPEEVLTATINPGNVPSTVLLEVSRETLCLFTILFEARNEFPPYKPDVPIRSAKFFVTLFRTAISPNAP